MIDTFESTARACPDRVFLTCIDASGAEAAYTYRQVRLMAAALALRLREMGVREGSYVVADLPNGLAFAVLALSAGYGSFALVALNNRLTATEKISRLAELERAGAHAALRIDAAKAESLMKQVGAFLASGDAEAAASDIFGSSDSSDAPKASFFAGRRHRGARHAQPHKHAAYILQQKRHRPLMGAREDAFRETVHFAERAAHLFDAARPALVMFTSGTTGKSKAVQLSWARLTASAQAANRSLATGEGLWQAALPLYHVGGFQIMVRSIEARRPFILYERFDARRVLSDVRRYGATHLSVVDKMLQDLLEVDDQGVLREYRCILLGGGPLNDQTAARARRAQARLFASYGMTETASMIASTLLTGDVRGEIGLRLMQGYEARIVDADERGFGSLAVKGPGVFSGYLNAQAAFTVDGFFLTGDTAALRNGWLYLKERMGDMFVSGGENVYPAEIAAALRRLPGVAEAHVFGVPDPAWGRRPVAVIERASTGVFSQEPPLVAPAVRAQLAGVLSKLNMPECICLLDEMPRSGIGKVDRVAAERLFESRIQVDRIILHRIRLPFVKPFATPKAVLTHREGIIVEIVDCAGRRGLGECVSFETDWYLPETLEQDWRALEDVIVPAVKGEAFLHPREVSRLLAAIPELADLPMACAAVENALWDLYGHIVGKPLWQLLCEEYAQVEERMRDELSRLADAGRVQLSWRRRATSALVSESRAMVPAGAVVGVGSSDEVLAAVRACVEEGYRRVKLKVSPGQGLDCTRAVREAFPQLLVTLDANQSFSTRQSDELRAFDGLHVGWIEEPLAALWGASAVGRSAFERLAQLQERIATPVCLDESFVNAAQARDALRFEGLRCVCVKIGKFGGAQQALEFVCLAQMLGREVWMGGMYDTGISKRLHAAFQVLPGLVVPGDIGSTSRYFAHDIALPAYEASHGYVTLNSYGYETGLGCSLNKEALKQVRIARLEL